MGHWNHRVIKHKGDSKRGQADWYAIHEVFYHDNDISYTTEPIDTYADDDKDSYPDGPITSLRWQLEHMLKALDKPILDGETRKEIEEKENS